MGAEDFFWPKYASFYNDTYIMGLLRKGTVALGLANDCTECSEIEEEIYQTLNLRWMHAQDSCAWDDQACRKFPREELTELLQQGEEHCDEHAKDVHLSLVLYHLDNLVSCTPGGASADKDQDTCLDNTQYTGGNSWKFW